jgi:uncharacterized membrane protein
VLDRDRQRRCLTVSVPLHPSRKPSRDPFPERPQLRLAFALAQPPEMVNFHSTRIPYGVAAFLCLHQITGAFQVSYGNRRWTRQSTVVPNSPERRVTLRVPYSRSTVQRLPTPLLQTYSDDVLYDEDGDEEPPFQATTDLVVKETSLVLKRVSWFSWWSQIILTTVSAVILSFSRSVVGRNATVGPVPSFLLSGAGVLISACSIIWTWGNGARLSRRLLRRPTTRSQAADMLRRAVRVGVTLNLIGLLVTLLAAEEIVGALAIKVLTNRNFGPQAALLGSVEGQLQPLDILVVQANTNTLLSHFCSLVSLLYLSDKIRQLGLPPSTAEVPRQRKP